MFGSSLEGINELLNGGYDKENIVSLYASAGVGKTLLLIQEGYNIAKNNKCKVLFIDTEGGARRFLDEWESVFPGIKDKFIIVTKRRVSLLMEYFGVEIKIERKGEKTVVNKIGEIPFKKTDIYSDIKKNKVGIVFVDSITAPFREFGSTTQNFPARADCCGMLYVAMIDVIDGLGVSMINTHHSSLNPTNPFATANIRGGDVVAYYSKIIMFMERPKSKKARDFRKVHLVRYPNKASWKEMKLLKYTDEGIRDSNREELTESNKSKGLDEE